MSCLLFLNLHHFHFLAEIFHLRAGHRFFHTHILQEHPQILNLSTLVLRDQRKVHFREVVHGTRRSTGGTSGTLGHPVSNAILVKCMSALGHHAVLLVREGIVADNTPNEIHDNRTTPKNTADFDF